MTESESKQNIKAFVKETNDEAVFNEFKICWKKKYKKVMKNSADVIDNFCVNLLKKRNLH